MSDMRMVRQDRRSGHVREMTKDEIVEHALSWAFDVLRSRDDMNAAVHCTPVRYSPVTQLVADALDLMGQRLRDAGLIP